MTENLQPDRRGSLSSLLVPLTALGCAVAAALAIGPSSAAQRQAIGFAAAVCGGGLAAAWAVMLVGTSAPAARVAASLAATTLRLMPAIAALAWLQTAGGSLARHGAAGYLVAFYLAALAAEVLRIIMERRDGPRRRGDSEVI